MKFTAGILFVLLGILRSCFCFFVTNSSTITYCEQSKGLLRCPDSQILDITGANYGRTKTGASVCQHDELSTSVTNCIAVSSLAIVQSNCQNKTSCELFASDSVFGNPCSGTYKYLAVEYRCTGPNLIISTTGTEEIRCPLNKKAYVEFASFVGANNNQTSLAFTVRFVCENYVGYSIRWECSIQGYSVCLLEHFAPGFFPFCAAHYSHLEVRYKCI